MKSDIPEQLSNLNISERLLIQKVAPFIPTLHLKPSFIAVKGHCVAFPNDMTKAYQTFSLKQGNISTYMQQMGNENIDTVKLNHVHVRKEMVINALQ